VWHARCWLGWALAGRLTAADDILDRRGIQDALQLWLDELNLHVLRQTQQHLVRQALLEPRILERQTNSILDAFLLDLYIVEAGRGEGHAGVQ